MNEAWEKMTDILAIVHCRIITINYEEIGSERILLGEKNLTNAIMAMQKQAAKMKIAKKKTKSEKEVERKT